MTDTFDIRISAGQRILLLASLRAFVPFDGVDPSASADVVALRHLFLCVDDICISVDQRVLIIAALRDFVPFNGVDPSASAEVVLLRGMFRDAVAGGVQNDFTF